MNVELEAASPDVAVSGSGRIGLVDEAPARFRFSVTNTRLDPFARALQPGLSAMTALVASGTVTVDGELLDLDRLGVDVRADRLALTVFDFELENDGPVRLSLADNVVHVDRMRLRGEETNLELAGDVALADERFALRAEGNAGLGILEGPDSRRAQPRKRCAWRPTSAARSMRLSSPARLAWTNGRVRHLSLPHALDAVNGRVILEPGGVRFDELTAELGGGPVGLSAGRVGLEGYRLGDLDVTATGRDISPALSRGHSVPGSMRS